MPRLEMKNYSYTQKKVGNLQLKRTWLLWPMLVFFNQGESILLAIGVNKMARNEDDVKHFG
jgi:hypothetical protein